MDTLAENTENTEVTPATSEVAENIPEQPSLAEAVQESKDAISSAEPVKRRGRPKKDPNAPAKEKSKKTAEPAQPAAAVIPTPPPTYLKPVINFPFQAAALKSGWAGWNLTEKEQEENAVLLDSVLKRYVPQFGSEHPELFALCLSLGMAVTARYMAFQAILRQHAANEAAAASAGDTVVSQNGAAPGPVGAPRVDRPNRNKKTDTAVKPSSGLTNFLDNGTPAPAL
ncbi:MAG: hypothetical protein AB7T49_21615 [Oligoflexales bacterium]